MKSLLLFVLITSQAVYGQDIKLSKVEKKALIKEAKMYKSNPEKLKSLKQEVGELQSIVNDQEQELIRITREVKDKDVQISSLKSQLASAENELSQFLISNQTVNKTPVMDKGVTFRVQIGGYTKRDLSDYADPEGRYLKVEKNNLGIQEITLGYFTSYRKADEFKKHLRAMGLKDAWIVPYRDGKRVLLKEVLNEISLEGNKVSKK